MKNQDRKSEGNPDHGIGEIETSPLLTNTKPEVPPENYHRLENHEVPLTHEEKGPPGKNWQ